MSSITSQSRVSAADFLADYDEVTKLYMLGTAAATDVDRSYQMEKLECCELVVDPLSYFAILGLLFGATAFLNVAITMNIGRRRRRRSSASESLWPVAFSVYSNSGKQAPICKYVNDCGFASRNYWHRLLRENLTQLGRDLLRRSFFFFGYVFSHGISLWKSLQWSFFR